MTKQNRTEARKEKQFQIVGHPRYEFRDWVKEQFPELGSYSSGEKEYQDLKRRLPEVHQAAMIVLGKVMRFSAESLQDYYRQDVVNLQQAFDSRDVKAYAKHLDSFIGGIDWE